MKDGFSLWRNPVEISSELEAPPPPPEGPSIFGLSEAVTTIKIRGVNNGDLQVGQNVFEHGGELKITIAAARDDDGAILSISTALLDKLDGKTRYDSVALDEKDVRRIGAAIRALLELTPEASHDEG